MRPDSSLTGHLCVLGAVISETCNWKIHSFCLLRVYFLVEQLQGMVAKRSEARWPLPCSWDHTPDCGGCRSVTLSALCSALQRRGDVCLRIHLDTLAVCLPPSSPRPCAAGHCLPDGWAAATFGVAWMR